MNGRALHPSSYDELLQLAAQCGRPVTRLLALAPDNDPFRADHPTRRREAEWFARLWELTDSGPGTHLRRLHYRLISQEEPPTLLDGSPYENTERCWKLLGRTSTAARYLGLVPASYVVDRRNPAPWINLQEDRPHEIEILGASSAVTAWIPLQRPWLRIQPPFVAQRYHLEIWCEKSTINDILSSLGLAYAVNIIPAVGEISATACHLLVQRARVSERPVRILYISDFDPAGRSMPVAAARKIEHFLQRAPDFLDVTLQPIALTPEQCVEYRLPRTPIKETERRGAAFEQRFGAGATELDALEALHPGVLRRIITAELMRFYDATLTRRTEEAVEVQRTELNRISRGILAKQRRTWDAITATWQAMRPQIEALNQRISKVSKRAAAAMEAAASELEIEWPEPEPGDDYAEDEPLFDSRRGYLDQLEHYQTFQQAEHPQSNGEDL